MEEILDGATDGKFLYKMKMLNKSNINKMTYKVSIPRSCDSVKVKSNSIFFINLNLNSYLKCAIIHLSPVLNIPIHII